MHAGDLEAQSRTHNNSLGEEAEKAGCQSEEVDTSLYLRSCDLFLLARSPLQPMNAV